MAMPFGLRSLHTWSAGVWHQGYSYPSARMAADSPIDPRDAHINSLKDPAKKDNTFSPHA